MPTSREGILGVIEDAHQRCYKPFSKPCTPTPTSTSPRTSGLAARLAPRTPSGGHGTAGGDGRRGQVELFSSGDTEPALAAIPHRDRVGQCDAEARAHRVRPASSQGAWLTERVWESSSWPALAATGIGYVTVTTIISSAPARRQANWTVLQHRGRRHPPRSLPDFRGAALTVCRSRGARGDRLLEGLADEGHAAAVYFDDIEKFGIWPETYDWVYHRRLAQGADRGRAASLKGIRTATYADFHAANATRGIVYLPTTSYSEMNEWTLPMPAAGIYGPARRRKGRRSRCDLRPAVPSAAASGATS